MSQEQEGLWVADGTCVLFPDNAGGFDVRDCPAPQYKAKRIAACVNACRSLPTEMLETVGQIVVSGAIPHRLLTMQRDELLDVLERVLPFMDACAAITSQDMKDFGRAAADADRIIKKIKG